MFGASTLGSAPFASSGAEGGVGDFAAGVVPIALTFSTHRCQVAHDAGSLNLAISLGSPALSTPYLANSILAPTKFPQPIAELVSTNLTRNAGSFDPTWFGSPGALVVFEPQPFEIALFGDVSAQKIFSVPSTYVLNFGEHALSYLAYAPMISICVFGQITNAAAYSASSTRLRGAFGTARRLRNIFEPPNHDFLSMSVIEDVLEIGDPSLDANRFHTYSSARTSFGAAEIIRGGIC